ncbi:MAG: hypothetical protein D3915_07450 [Candidatus Electrothrix sp. AU1_5]|nr:hypothetical protein [Candidatus Electrothrix gigas]
MTSKTNPPQSTRRDFLKKIGTAGLTHFAVVNITIDDLTHFLFLNKSEKNNSENGKNEKCQTAFSDTNELLSKKCMLGDECVYSYGLINKEGCFFGYTDPQVKKKGCFFGYDGSQNGISFFGGNNGGPIISPFKCFCIDLCPGDFLNRCNFLNFCKAGCNKYTNLA